MQKKEQSSRQIAMCHLILVMGIDVDEANQLVAEMEQVGLIQFNQSGNLGILMLEGQS
ncbi:TPA: hypothetical protein ACJVH8_000240 [Streptococcus agalactiae]